MDQNYIPEEVQEYLDYMSQEIEKMLADPLVGGIIQNHRKTKDTTPVDDYDRAMDILKCSY